MEFAIVSPTVFDLNGVVSPHMSIHMSSEQFAIKIVKQEFALSEPIYAISTRIRI